MTVTAKITNETELLRKLTRLPAKMKERVAEVMAKQADEIVAMMKRLVPVDEGDLRDSIAWKWGRRAPKGAMSVATVDGGDLAITIYTTDFKARWQEFGTVKMAANPFFFVSWRASRKGIRRRIQGALRQAAKEVASGS